MYMWVASTFWLFWIMLCWTLMYKFLCGPIFHFWGIYLGVELLGYITLCLAFWATVKQFSKVTEPFYIPTSNVWMFQFLHILTNTCSLFNFSHSSECELVSHSDWLYISLIMMLNIFSCVYLPLVYLLWRNVYSNPLQTFKLYYLCFYCCKSSLYTLDICDLQICIVLWVIFSFSC